MTVGNLVHSLDDMTADEDAGVFASESYDSIPVPPSDYAFHDNNLQSLGNYWSGVTIEDQAVPAGFPSTEFEDPQRYQVTNASGNKMKKVATNIPLVLDLSSKFLKEYGKKGLTRRHVMAFLQKSGSHQYLASDVVRCLKEVHDIDVKDVLDEFPITHTASSSSLASMRDMLVDLEIHNIRNPETSKVFRYAAADLSRTIALLERLGVDNV
jgi:hypothetical protein